jgi:hypothetical protein
MLLLISLAFSQNLARGQNLTEVSSSFFTGAQAVVIRDNYAYASYVRGLVIIDITNPAKPTMISQCPIQGIGWDIALSGDYAYIASGSAYGDGNVCLHVIDISNVQAPMVVASIDSLDYFSMDVAVEGNIACLVGDCFYPWTNNFVVVDITIPRRPLVIGGMQLGNTPTDVVILDTLAYVAGGRSVTILNIAHPHQISILGSASTANDVFGLTIEGSYLYMAENEGGNSSNLQIFSLADRIHPALVGSFDAYCIAWGVSVSGNYAYLADFDSSLQIIDISNMTHPVLAGTYNPYGSTFNIFSNGDYAYMVNARAGVEIVDVSDPSHPESAGRYGPDWNPQNVCISGHYAYISQDLFYNTHHLGAMSIFDISHPEIPAMISEYTSEYGIEDVQVSGNYAYLASKLGGLIILNISNPLNPSQISQYSNYLYPEKLAIYGNYVYTISFNGLDIYNVTLPSTPIYLGHENIYALNCIRISGNKAYISGPSILYIYDLSNPAGPILIESYNTDFNYDNIDVNLNYVFANGLRYFQILDVSNPTDPVLLSSIEAWGSGSEICVSHNKVYFASSNEGFEIYDVGNLRQPQQLVSNYHLSGGVGVAVSGEYIYLVGEHAFDILSYPSQGIINNGSGAALSALLQVQDYPNPFNAQTTISYSLPKASEISLDIFDILGRKIETLQSGHQEAGEHSVIWNAGDKPSGIYFYRLKAGEREETNRMVLLK